MTEQAEKVQSEWLEVVNIRHREYVEKARGDKDSFLDNKSPRKQSRKSLNSVSGRTSLKASTASRQNFVLARIRCEEIEENKTAARIAGKEYEIEMAERECEMVTKRHEMDLFSKKRQIDLEKLHDENLKPLIEAKMQEVKLMVDESLLLEKQLIFRQKVAVYTQQRLKIALKTGLRQLVFKKPPS